MLAGPDESLPDQVVHAVHGLVGDEPAGEVPAAGDIGRVGRAEEDVAGCAPGMVAAGILRVWVPAGGAVPDGAGGGEHVVDGGGAGGDASAGAGRGGDGRGLGRAQGAGRGGTPIGGCLGKDIGHVGVAVVVGEQRGRRVGDGVVVAEVVGGGVDGVVRVIPRRRCGPAGR